jgi:hypothetical protein
LEREHNDVGIVRELLAPIDENEGEMKGLLEKEPLLEPLRRLVAPDAPIEFEVPGGGFVGDMSGPFRGPEGFLDGWREWLNAWDEFRIETQEVIAAGEGRVLVLARLGGTLRGTDVTVSQDGGGIWTVANGQVIAIEHFLDQDQARRAAGLA